MRRYKILSADDKYIGTFCTEYDLAKDKWLQDIVEKTFDGAARFAEIPEADYRRGAYYVYRHEGISCNRVTLLGQVESQLSIEALWDILFQVFCSDGKGMFIRKNPI